MGLTISEMRLEPAVEARARTLKSLHPGVIFTSGRRSPLQQAEAMGANVVAGGRDWIKRTYADSAPIRALQHWVDEHPEAHTAHQIAAGLAIVLQRLPEAELEHVSRHLVGRAFDVEPGSCPLSALEALHPEKLLTHEGGLVRWHVQW